MKINLIKCAMFDSGNVLAIFDTLRWYDFINHHRRNCVEPYELFSGSLDHIIKKYDLGEMSDLDFFYKVRGAYRLWSINSKDFFEVFGAVLLLDRDMLEVVNRLRQRGLTTVLITNMNTFHAQYIRQHYPELMSSFDYKIISCEEGIVKPNPEAWVRPLDRIGLKAEECVFIDDHPPNIKVACSLGISGWHYNVTDNNFCPNGRLDEERKRFKDFLNCLDSIGLLYDKNKARV